MQTIFIILALVPLGLWALGGFRVVELLREKYKIVAWYTVLAAAYLVWGILYGAYFKLGNSEFRSLFQRFFLLGFRHSLKHSVELLLIPFRGVFLGELL